MQMLAQLEAVTGRQARHGLFVINMEYGRNFSGPDKDVFFYDRSVGYTEDAWQSNFLHPVIYYYRHLPTGEWLCAPSRLGFLRWALLGPHWGSRGHHESLPQHSADRRTAGDSAPRQEVQE